MNTTRGLDITSGFQIRFDGPPTPIGGRLVEVETLNGRGVHVGRWEQDDDSWLLVVDPLGEQELVYALLGRISQRGVIPPSALRYLISLIATPKGED